MAAGCCLDHISNWLRAFTMATVLTKNLSRELEKFPGIIITATPDGISFKVKRKQRSLHVSWEKVFGAAAMIDANEQVMLDACRVALNEVGYKEEQDES